jgi:arsenate reductase-like glutaredoxin family protein
MEIEERDFFKEPFSREELQDLANEEGLGNLFARRSPSLKKLGLDGQDLPDSQMMDLMLQEPRLIRRPLVRIGSTLVVGANMKTMEAALDSSS